MAGWTLRVYVDWLVATLPTLGFQLRPGLRQTRDIRMVEVVGISEGTEVHTIRVETDGRNVHAYPVGDSQ